MYNKSLKLQSIAIKVIYFNISLAFNADEFHLPGKNSIEGFYTKQLHTMDLIIVNYE